MQRMSASRASSKGRQTANARTQTGNRRAQAGKAGAQQVRTQSRNGGRQATAKPLAEPGPPQSAWQRVESLPRTMGWLRFTVWMLSIIGLADASYQVYTHFSGSGLLGCSASTDSCVLVQNSSYAWIFGIPVAVYGAAFFVFMVVICSPWGWRLQQPLVRYARLAAVVIGMIFVLYLIYREVITLGQICEYCTSVHIITFLIFGLIVYDASAPRQVTPAGRQ